ncbi:MAG: hypothetical protein ACRCUS_08290 [Anaerovoracaceae bacterium]
MKKKKAKKGYIVNCLFGCKKLKGKRVAVYCKLAGTDYCPRQITFEEYLLGERK